MILLYVSVYTCVDLWFQCLSPPPLYLKSTTYIMQEKTGLGMLFVEMKFRLIIDKFLSLVAQNSFD